LSAAGLALVREGTTPLLVPGNYNTRGPGSRSRDVFYNKQMEFGRDLSVMVGRAVFQEGQKILDGLAASGARGLRLANECGVKADFVLNDSNLAAAVLMKQNAEQNSLSHVRIECRDLRSLLADEKFDYIDIDPFGTPIDFVDSAVQSCRNDGIIAVTATDTAPLYGVYPKTCLRRYGALSQRSPFAHETGLRILVGYMIRQAAAHDRAAQPLLCYHADHYFRCYLQVRNGAARADALVRKLGYSSFDSKTLDRRISDSRATDRDAGPLWAGPLFSKDLLKRMKATGDLGTANRCDRYLHTWTEECTAPALFYSMDELARRTKSSPPKLADFVDFLKDKGAAASRTHFDPKGLKTDMRKRWLLDAYKRFPRT
jgi:tRNA (guanine26-N2/guanine27-N2)-dimethyltransferase